MADYQRHVLFCVRDTLCVSKLVFDALMFRWCAVLCLGTVSKLVSKCSILKTKVLRE